MEEAQVTVPVIGFGKDAGVRIDLAALLERRLLIQAASGAGKSTLVRALAEQLVGHVQQWVIDREGDFVTLREVGDFVLVGRGGDVPADRKSVKLLARRLMELGASAVFDLSELRMHEQREYVKLLFDELTHMPRSLWHQLMVWLDEGHFFAPQAEKCVSTQAVADAASVWRKRGYCLAVATQRLSKLDKDVAAELHNKFIGFTDDVDLRRAGDQLGMTTEQRAELQQLDPGVFYAYGPAISRTRVLVRGPKPKTSPPAKGEARAIASTPPEKVRAILAKLVDLAKEADEEARTTEDLKRTVAERDRKIRQLERGCVVQTVEKPVVDQAAVASAYRLGEIAAEARMVKSQRDATRAMRGMIDNLARVNPIIDMIGGSLKQMVASIESVKPAQGEPPKEPTAVKREVRAPARPIATASTTAEGVTPSMQRMLNALASFEQLGIRPAKRVNVAFFAGYTENGHFNNMCGTLRTAGLIDYPQGGMLELTDAGRAIADGAAHPIDSLQQLHDTWLSKVSPSEGKLLSEIISRYPGEISRVELAERAGYTENGHFNNMLGRLRSLGAIDYPRGAHVVATDVLFPEGL